MKIRLPYIVQDQLTAAYKGLRPVETFKLEGEEHFLDGPTCPRVAVLDFDERTGALHDPVPFEPPSDRRTTGRYVVRDERDLESRDLGAVSAFATVLRTMRAFEANDVLGRRLAWGFDGPQLFVVPRAGDWANAFYQRETRSLQFFSFESMAEPGRRIHTGLSHDIVAHETGHAILDGIAPDLYDAVTPQALAIHEAVADLTALVLALDSHNLRETVLNQIGGRLDGPTAFSAVAEEFGRALGEGDVYLRSLWNDKSLARDATDENRVPRDNPHALSEVLTGALYKVFVKIYDKHKQRPSREVSDLSEKQRAEFSGSGKALYIASAIFRRMVFRALDYLPPGEVSFADYGRAIVASDRAANPRTGLERRQIANEFARRGIVGKASDLTATPPDVAFPDLDLEALVESDWAAYDFANKNRKLLGIPKDIPFRIHPRLHARKITYRGAAGPWKYAQLIFKVSWEYQEQNRLDARFPENRAILKGTTLVLDWKSGEVKARLTTDTGVPTRRDRDAFLRKLVDHEALEIGNQSPPGHPLGDRLETETTGGVLRVHGTARTLHILAHGEEERR